MYTEAAYGVLEACQLGEGKCWLHLYVSPDMIPEQDWFIYQPPFVLVRTKYMARSVFIEPRHRG